jgi:hypothetical protein
VAWIDGRGVVVARATPRYAPPMNIDLVTLKAAVRLAGFDFTDAELEALRPGLERAFEQLARLETLPVAGIDPAVQYRMF